jgi:hypothetical protein
MDVHDTSTTWTNNVVETSDCAMDYSRRAAAHLQQTGDLLHLRCIAAQVVGGLSGRVNGCEQQDRAVENAAETSAARQRLSPPELLLLGPQPRS